MKFNADKLRGKLKRDNKKTFSVSVGISPGTKVPDKVYKSKRTGENIVRPVKISMEELATILRLGNSWIPARDYIQVAKDSYMDSWVKLGTALVKTAIFEKRNVHSDLLTLGQVMRSDLMKAIIDSEKYVPNSPVTLKYKSGNRPLYDRGYFYKSFNDIKVKVE